MRRVILLVVAALAIAVLAWLSWQRANEPQDAAPIAALPDTMRAGLKAVRLYFAAPTGDSLVSEQREMVEEGHLHERVASLIAALDRGPTKGGVAALPAGTALLHAYSDERGLLTVDLSLAFERNFRGGSSAEYLALASLVRTLGDNVPGVERVFITCGGASLATLGGHLPLDRPIGIDQWP